MGSRQENSFSGKMLSLLDKESDSDTFIFVGCNPCLFSPLFLCHFCFIACVHYFVRFGGKGFQGGLVFTRA